jgi:uncharacterized Zn finger protein
MSIEGWDDPICPNCGSEKVVVELRGGYFFVVQCRKCGFRANEKRIEVRT